MSPGLTASDGLAITALGQFAGRDDRLDAFFQVDKRAEGNQAGDFHLDDIADVVLLADLRPGVGQDLAQAEADAALIQLQLQDHDIQFLAVFAGLRSDA